MERSGFWVTIARVGLQTSQRASLQNLKYSLCKSVVLYVKQIVISRAGKEIMWYHWDCAQHPTWDLNKLPNEMVSIYLFFHLFLFYVLIFFKYIYFYTLKFDTFDTVPVRTLTLGVKILVGRSLCNVCLQTCRQKKKMFQALLMRSL